MMAMKFVALLLILLPVAAAMTADECIALAQPPDFVRRWSSWWSGVEKTPMEYYEKSMDSSLRCCGADTSACKCPIRNWLYASRWQDWCGKMQQCKKVPVTAP
eukprot:CAMPEP_0174332404 /NCGR_PEP_ID=MMETSP0810-20121108/18273_1 /TAXON_ID=73025 ORGANISM="Eutreptiella gymnastica-like, Strain CCMP1594" /NCGR_SAMPLE_ID=MMETSP0810 /ASSEMBLY_ACC=CAM_ASM_000659 /LENGTH=102 /DNA_ID=CAMNT_0015448797 /DNA_START=24 /DNA_END=332 /DNA_ORIENTATION=-